MRVIHIVQTLVAGGAESMVRTLCPGLAADGVDVQVVSVYPSGLDAAQRAAIRAPVHEIGRRGRTDLSYFPRLVRTLRTLRPDVVHAHLHTGQYAGRAAALMAGVPAIAMTVHGPEPGGPLRRGVDRVLHARTARFIVFTESQRRRYAAEHRVPLERIAVIPNGVVPRTAFASRAELRAQLGLPQDAFVFFNAARLAPEKNQRAAIDAMRAVRDAGFPDALLVIAGTGPLEAELHAHARDTGASEYVRFLGYRADVRELYPAMDAFLQPSHWERMPMALGEAMLAGLPPVMSPWEGWDDMVTGGESALVAAGFDAGALADAMLRAVRDRDALARVAAAAKARACATFDVDAMIRTHAALYAALVRETAR
ncbi:MAG: glycosyltransferase [Candidatus Eremiobacteraeota bacterium]|nr:glycosyltransferase [Candidatus Eremiobacteraeota bacterium]